MAARKKSQEEKNLRTLRELASLSANKQCFDCHQRGPTYVNMLIGSFVCTSCSGILRGLNPPHRVKSITMTVFTPEEVEFIKSRGNDYCRQVWLGLYDPRSLLEPESRDEQKIKEFMIQKYEKKRWYISPENVTFNSQQPKIPVPDDNTGSQQLHRQHSETKPLSALLGREPPVPLVLQSPPQGSPWTQSSSNFNHNSLNNHNNNINTTSQFAQPPGSKNVDLLSGFGADPFSPVPAPPATQVPQPVIQNAPPPQPPNQLPAPQVSYSSANGNFANFESAFSDSMSSGSSGFTPEAPGNTSFAAFQSNVISPPPTFMGRVESNRVEMAPHAPVTDRYAALADLDSLFHTHQDSNSSSSALSSCNGPSPPPPTSAAPVASSTTPWGVNTSTVVSAPAPNHLTSAISGQQQPSNAPNPFAAALPAMDSWSNIPQSNHPNGAQKQPVAFNPFQQQLQQQQPQGYVSNPYTGMPAFNNMEGFVTLGSQTGFFSPYIQPVGAPIGDLGGPQIPYAMQNGGNIGHTFGPGAWTGQGPQMCAPQVGWMQAATNKVGYTAVQPQANPFLSGASAPKLNPGNPFL